MSEQIREQIAIELHRTYWSNWSGLFPEQAIWEYCEEWKKEEWRKKADDQILSLILSRGGGTCQECGGCGKVWDSLSHHMDYPCPTCKGSGILPEETKQVGQILEEWEK